MIINWFVEKKIFRNENHAIWFFMSIAIFLVFILLYFFPKNKIVFIFPIAIHLLSFFMASISVFIKKESSNLFSKDCIWFNLLMIFVYVILYLVF